ncbi:UDP-3-O-[3-hydroxymyristoyl] glucosamine N-acyltransferase [Meinhardsimonia xiamenensis]|jgi:UDP-3-O-[3-hydroxymyristoyl] glucosamine N-acyltransferase|uniref:UDP-3-O-acylglucosamine N-acyltransferase n=1 Tax=Meinhardsimonia xiamenensis TaxID=990712 RepID=A0A1G9BF20_9RHOB|nr:UDP-3-O-(3-hydroxymyristoyl)glucosamine N-acyltransferase [Meinhardsimonia xiamenensis]PRX35003.1 UDP-3-O-[3-hydroxymyristoyl] glucosamine N-acyltransferase [Meinhardsimonia xiamenensis]SDK38118.1 UDP-3-O-[3-hydroxymyristoyl] glucosamine N-acyltransferase [Meinhardsimonia xiamenensis]
MPDPRFHPIPEPLTLAEAARIAGAELGEGADPDALVTGAAPLAAAGPGDVTFLTRAAFLDALGESRAGACLATPELAPRVPPRMAALLHPDPQRGYVTLLRRFFPERDPRPGISPAAHVDPAARLGDGCRVEAGAVIGAGAEIGPASLIGPGAVIGPGVVLGERARIGANAVISHTLAGARLRVLAGAVIGEEGFGFIPGAAGLERIPQMGRVIIGDDVEIGACTTIDRGAGDDTVIGDGTKIDNQVQIGHNCRIGRHCVIVAQVGLSGSVEVGDFVQLGGKVGAADHVKIGAGARLAAGSGVTGTVPPGATYAGFPARPIGEWHRANAALRRLALGKRRDSGK